MESGTFSNLPHILDASLSSLYTSLEIAAKERKGAHFINRLAETISGVHFLKLDLEMESHEAKRISIPKAVRGPLF